MVSVAKEGFLKRSSLNELKEENSPLIQPASWIKFHCEFRTQNRLQNQGLVTVITVVHSVHCSSRHHTLLPHGVKVINK